VQLQHPVKSTNPGSELCNEQDSYKSSEAKLPDFSSHGMIISPTLSKQ